MSAADRDRWERRWRTGDHGPPLPEPWLVANARHLPRGPVLDLACGAGRNALWLAAHGWSVTALDIAPSAIARLEHEARSRGLPITTRCADLDEPGALSGLGPFGGIVVIRFKPAAALWPRLIARLEPGGRVLLCSFGRERAAAGSFDPAFCLDEAELRGQLEPALSCLLYERLGPAADWLEGSIWEKPAATGGSSRAPAAPGR